MIRARCGIRFGLCAVLVVLSLVCIFIGIAARQANRQRSAVTWIRKKGGEVVYGFEASFEPVVSGDLPGPDWLCRLVGVDFFATVRGVGLNGTQVSDVAVLQKLPDLFSLDLEDTPIRDIASLRCLSQLAILNLEGTQVSDVSPLANLERLSWLNLSETEVRSLSPLQNLRALSYLKLSRMDGLEYLEVVKLRQSLPSCTIERE